MRKIDSKKTIIEVSDVFFSYGAEEVLKNVSFDVHRGDYLGMIGPNGAGKTTLLKCLLGLLTPRDGTIKLFGEDIREFNDWIKIGYVPQKATHFDPNFPATVREVVLMGRYARRGLFRQINRQDSAMVKTALEQVDMWDYRDRLVGNLSGGQQQRVFIARSLAGEPKVLFLDEPTAGIDKKSQDEFYALLRKLNRDLHLTLVLVSHDIERVIKEAVHVVCIDRTLVCNLSVEEFIKESHAVNIFDRHVNIISHRNHHH